MPAWFRDTVEAGLAFVEADSEAGISGWYCEACNQSGSGRPIAADAKIQMSDVRLLYPKLHEIDCGLAHDCGDGGYILIGVNATDIPTDADRTVECGVYASDGVEVSFEVVAVDDLQSWIDKTLLARSTRTIE